MGSDGEPGLGRVLAALADKNRVRKGKDER